MEQGGGNGRGYTGKGKEESESTHASAQAGQHKPVHIRIHTHPAEGLGGSSFAANCCCSSLGCCMVCTEPFFCLLPPPPPMGLLLFLDAASPSSLKSQSLESLPPALPATASACVCRWMGGFALWFTAAGSGIWFGGSPRDEGSGDPSSLAENAARRRGTAEGRYIRGKGRGRGGRVEERCTGERQL